MPAAAASLTPSAWWRRTRQRLFRLAPADREPVVLRHSRIYILPTRRGAAFIATLAIMLVTSLNYALSLGFGVTFVFAGLVSAGLLHTFRNLAGIELRPIAASETYAGGPLAFTLTIAGHGTRRLGVSIAPRGAAAVTIDVPAERALTVTLEVPTSKRGRQPLGRVTLSSDFPLGLWRGWAYVHFPLSGIVYPAPEPNAPPLPGGSDGHDAHAAVRGDDSDLAGLREYQTGDPLQRVAWKAVARGAGWFSKQFDGAGGGGPVVLAWHALPVALDDEQRLARLTAWVLAAERAARPFALTLPVQTLAASQGREHRRTALTVLALYPEPLR